MGRLLVQMAKAKGAKVIGTVSTEAKAELAKSAGADEIVFYTQTDFEEETLKITEGKGVNVVYDSVGKTTFLKGLNILKVRGTMVSIGQASGQIPTFDVNILNPKGLYLTRPMLGHYVATQTELLNRANDLFSFLTKGEITLNIDQTFDFADIQKAHHYLESRQAKGKVLLRVSGN